MPGSPAALLQGLIRSESQHPPGLAPSPRSQGPLRPTAAPLPERQPESAVLGSMSKLAVSEPPAAPSASPQAARRSRQPAAQQQQQQQQSPAALQRSSCRPSPGQQQPGGPRSPGSSRRQGGQLGLAPSELVRC